MDALLNEDFLQFVWKFRLYNPDALHTTEGEIIRVHSPGIQNTHAGPDFEDAKLRIGDTLWAGSVEVHIATSGWQQHNHTVDKAYNNVILHVVYQHDTLVNRPDGSPMPVLVLENAIDPQLIDRYKHLLGNQVQFIPCETGINQVDALAIQNWLTRVLIERLESRSHALLETLNVNRGDWEETFYQYLAANFGFSINALPFKMLARSLPQQILGKHKNNPMQVEALLFGQAGFLQDDFTDDYPKLLQNEYRFLQAKYSLQPIEKHLWKFLRLRPLNFPTIRLAQFAALVTASSHLFSKILDIDSPAELRKLFTDIAVNPYWADRYLFDKPAKPASKGFGKTSADNILLNTVALFLFAYGNRLQQEQYVTRSLQLLEHLPLEKNNIIDRFVSLGVKPASAFESQALLGLKNNYCDGKKCLQCGIGLKLLKFN